MSVHNSTGGGSGGGKHKEGNHMALPGGNMPMAGEDEEKHAMEARFEREQERISPLSNNQYDF